MNDEPETPEGGGNAGEVNQKPVHAIRNSVSEGKKIIGWKKSIAIVTILTNIVLAFFTYRLYNQSVIATNTADSALLQAIRANDISGRALAESHNAVVAAQDANAISEKTFKNNERATKLSMVSNEPHLQIDAPFFINFAANQVYTLRYRILNLGNQAVRIVKTKFFIEYQTDDPKEPFVQFKRHPFIYDYNNRLISKETPFEGSSGASSTMSEAAITEIKNRKIFIYFFCYVDYLNEITKKSDNYTTIVKIVDPQGDQGFSIIK